MVLTNNLRKLLHRKSPEMLAVNPAGVTISGAFLTGDNTGLMPQNDHMYYVSGNNAMYRYSSDEDAWIQHPASGIAGTFGSGACGKFRYLACPGGIQTLTATGAGTTTTILTNLSIVRSLKGCRIRIVDGSGAGFDGTVLSNTMGANATITLSSAAPAATGVTTKFQIFAGSLWFFCPGAGAVGYRVYDVMTNTWNSKSVTNLPTTWATDGHLVSTESARTSIGAAIAAGTASASSTTTTLADTVKSWPVNGWSNYQVRIVSGTGLGQIRTIASNTATVLTLSAAWTTTVDATSVYAIEGNDDYLYLSGNAAVTMYRYSVFNDTWTVLAPTAARAAASNAGSICAWAVNVSAWAEANAITYSVLNSAGLICQNGRYIYSFRGGAVSNLDVYDIASNTWISSLGYGAQTEVFTTGSSGIEAKGMIYIQKDTTGRMFRFDVSTNQLEPLFVNPLPQSTAIVGVKMALQTYRDGANEIAWVYTLSSTRSEFVRFLLV